jgi:hypothetical protein
MHTRETTKEQKAVEHFKVTCLRLKTSVIDGNVADTGARYIQNTSLRSNANPVSRLHATNRHGDNVTSSPQNIEPALDVDTQKYLDILQASSSILATTALT